MVAHLAYNDVPLSNANVTILLNGAYSARVATNSSGALALYAPLSLGRNELLFEYASSEVSSSAYYFGGYLGVALMLAGASLFLSLRFLSERISGKSEVSIVCADVPDVPDSPIDLVFVSDVASELRRTGGCAMEGAPASVDDISSVAASLLGVRDSRRMSERISALFPDARYGVLCTSPRPYREVIARRLYDSAINNGGFPLRNFTSVRALFKSNSIVPFAESGASALRTLRVSKRLKIAALGPERDAFCAKISVAQRNCAFLLFNEINGFVDVIGCC